MSTFDEMEIQEIYEQALNDPSLVSELDIQELLDAIEEDKYQNLQNKTMQSLNEDIFGVVNELELTNEEKKSICEKLIGYKYVSEIQEIENGKYIRWIKEGSTKLTNGGIVTGTKFYTNGSSQIVCLNNARRFNQVRLDTNEIFQKLTPEEQILLMANEYVQS